MKQKKNPHLIVVLAEFEQSQVGRQGGFGGLLGGIEDQAGHKPLQVLHSLAPHVTVHTQIFLQTCKSKPNLDLQDCP